MKESDELGYIQKGNRYHFRLNDEIHLESGFKSKDECDEWISEVRNNYGFDYRCGFMVKFKNFDKPLYLVDKKGNEIKAF